LKRKDPSSKCEISAGAIRAGDPPLSGARKSEGRMRDFTTGSVPRHLLAFSLPLLIGNLLQALYNTVDSIWVGKFVGKEGLAAVSVSFPLIFALVSLVGGVAIATTVLVAQYFGAGQRDRVREVIHNNITLLLLGGAAASILGVLLRVPLLRLINVPAAVLPGAATYLAIFMGGLVFMFGYNVLGAILRGLGDSRTPLLFLAYSTVTNIILDPIFILGLGPVPRMGVAGAALATVISQGLATALAIRHLNRLDGWVRIKAGEMGLQRELTLTTLRIGLPAGLQQVAVSLAGITVMSFINSFGTSVVAGYGAAMRIDQFAFMPAMSMSLAVSALTGQNLGAGKHTRVREVIRWSLTMALAITFTVATIAFFLPQTLLSMFTDDSAVLAEGALYLRTVAWTWVAFAAMFVFNGVMRGAGDTAATMMFTVGSLWLVRVPLARYLSQLMGARGIWLAIAVSPLVGLALSFTYYLTGRWQNKVVTRGPSTQPAD